MRSRLARIGVVAVGLLALLGATTPAAHATTVGVFAFVGTATLDAPLGYFCATGTTPPTLIPNSKCPQGVLSGGGPLDTLLGTTKTLPLPVPVIGTVELGNLPYLHGGNTRAITSFDSIVCAGVGVNISKLGKAPAHAGATCTIGESAGTVTGWCGLSTGLVSGKITDDLGQTYAYRVHFYGIASELFISGHAVKQTNTPQTLLVRGVVNAIPVPTVGVPPGNSCAGKTATVFTVSGGIAAVG